MKKFAKILHKLDHFLITTHAQPDGDGIGSEIALCRYLQKIGKTAVIVNPSSTPEKFALADPGHSIVHFKKGDRLPVFQAVIIVDTNETKMLGELKTPIENAKVPILYVDHHVREEVTDDHHLIDEAIGSSGELVFHFLKNQEAEIDQEMAIAIYVAMITDTGNFRYKRTTSSTHEVAAELLRLGVRPETIYQNVYGKDSVEKIRLLGKTLDGLKLNAKKNIAWVTVTRKTRLEYGASIEDTEAYINYLTLLKGISIVALFREEDDGTVKISLRGMGDVPVIDIAKKFGGGGHLHAAGARISAGDSGALEKAVTLVMREAELLLDSATFRSGP